MYRINRFILLTANTTTIITIFKSINQNKTKQQKHRSENNKNTNNNNNNSKNKDSSGRVKKKIIPLIKNIFCIRQFLFELTFGNLKECH